MGFFRGFENYRFIEGKTLFSWRDLENISANCETIRLLLRKGPSMPSANSITKSGKVLQAVILH